ncbi:hypothetical protein ACP3V3_01730 [Vibrio sp. PNB22_3_1]
MSKLNTRSIAEVTQFAKDKHLDPAALLDLSEYILEQGALAVSQGITVDEVFIERTIRDYQAMSEAFYARLSSCEKAQDAMAEIVWEKAKSETYCFSYFGRKLTAFHGAFHGDESDNVDDILSFGPPSRAIKGNKEDMEQELAQMKQKLLTANNGRSKAIRTCINMLDHIKIVIA